MKTTLDFLTQLKLNNNRECFESNKKMYLLSQEEMIDFAEKLLEKTRKIDVLSTISGKKSLFRIYKDVRFSKDKTPYKTNRSGNFKREGAARRGSYYFSIEPGNSLIGGGFYQPNAEDLLHIRKQIEVDSAPLRNAIEAKAFKNYYGEFQGESLKTAPKGFDKEHADIDLLRRKHFYVIHPFTDQEVLASDFVEKVIEGFKILMPFFDCMSNYLITDLNGAPLLDEI